jgi:hypothetical protein
MSGMVEFNAGDEYELRTNEDGTDYEWVCISAEEDQSELFDELFYEVPHCPVGGNVIKITMVANEYGSVTIVTECCGDVECHTNSVE